MSNLGLDVCNLSIDSSALAIVSNKYCETDDQTLLAGVRHKVGNCDVVLFGGAPVFNYAYQWFFKKTATILRIAKELNKPVLFSAVGIDAYSESSDRCMLLKRELHNGSVAQITTRDGIEHLRDYATPPDAGEGAEPAFPIGLVSDPAVFTRTVFAKCVSETPAEVADSRKKRIGLFVFRAGGFTDNGVAFDHNMQRIMWRDLCTELESRGYDYELLTSGHFGDEAFLQDLIESGAVSGKKCIRNINTPESLAERINSYDGVVTCRLHPSIISFAYDVPSVSLIWNSKVTDFYRHIGYPERALSTESIVIDEEVSAERIIDTLERAIDEGVTKDNDYVESVYATLLDGLASCLNVDRANYRPYTGQELLDRMYTYDGTSVELERHKVKRKFARCYRKYVENQLNLGNLKKGSYSYPMIYHSGGYPASIDVDRFGATTGTVEHLASHNIQYRYPTLVSNNAINRFSACGFARDHMRFVGWKVRFRLAGTWYWCLENGGLIVRTKGSITKAALFHAGDVIPMLPVRRVDVMVAEAIWQNDAFQMRYNSGRSKGECRVGYDMTAGSIKRLASGSVEFSPNRATANNGEEHLLANRFAYADARFAGWRLRVKERGKWYWYCDNGSFVPTQQYNAHTDGSLRLFANNAIIPAFPGHEVETVVAEAVWKPKTGRLSSVFGHGRK